MPGPSAESVGLQLDAGAPLVLQRVPRSMDAETFARELHEVIGRAAVVIADVDELVPDAIRVLDARACKRSFANWDAKREMLGSVASPLVVLLDVATTRVLLTDAPHTASWAGGVWLPSEPVIRSARGESEIHHGKQLLEQHRLADHRGRIVGVDLLSARLFVDTEERSAADAAAEELDEAVLYMAYIPP